MVASKNMLPKGGEGGSEQHTGIYRGNLVEGGLPAVT